MRYILYNIQRLILLAMPGIAAYYMVPRMGASKTLLTIAGVALAAVTIAGVLLHLSEIGKVTWMNRVAGPLAPWGWRFCKGKLIIALLASWVIWILLAVPGVMVAIRPVALPAVGVSENSSASSIIKVLLVIVWIIDGGALLFLLASLGRNSMQSSGGKSLVKVLAFCLLVLGSSVKAFLGGHPIVALIIAGTPPSAIAGFFIVYLAIIFSTGKKFRWN